MNVIETTTRQDHARFVRLLNQASILPEVKKYKRFLVTSPSNIVWRGNKIKNNPRQFRDVNFQQWWSRIQREGKRVDQARQQIMKGRSSKTVRRRR